MSQERRAHARVDEDLGIAVSVMRETGPIPHLTSPAFHLTRDISEGGLRFVHDRELAAGTLLKVYVAMKIPLITLTQFARVCWARPVPEGGCEVGIEFTDGTEADCQVWRQYVTQLLNAGSN